MKMRACQFDTSSQQYLNSSVITSLELCHLNGYYGTLVAFIA